MEPKPSLISNIIAGIGIFFILVILIWIFANIGRWTPGFFASIGSFFHRTGTTLTVSLESPTVQSGTPTTISWNHSAPNGTYAFMYDCTAGVSMTVPDAAGVSTSLPCATAYVVSATGPHAIKVTPAASSSAATLVPFSITYRDQAGVSGASASDAITVTNGGGAAVATSTAPGKTSSGSGSVSSAPSLPDLVVRMIGLGIMQNGAYAPATAVTSNETLAVRFEIENDGAAATGPWRFTASLPSNPTYTYNSVAQQSLAPGDRIEYTLQFTNLAPQGGVMTIVADPDGAIRESSEANNGVSYRINVSY